MLSCLIEAQTIIILFFGHYITDIDFNAGSGGAVFVPEPAIILKLKLQLYTAYPLLI